MSHLLPGGEVGEGLGMARLGGHVSHLLSALQPALEDKLVRRCLGEATEAPSPAPWGSEK